MSRPNGPWAPPSCRHLARETCRIDLLTRPDKWQVSLTIPSARCRLQGPHHPVQCLVEKRRRRTEVEPREAVPRLTEGGSGPEHDPASLQERLCWIRSEVVRAAVQPRQI